MIPFIAAYEATTSPDTATRTVHVPRGLGNLRTTATRRDAPTADPRTVALARAMWAENRAAEPAPRTTPTASACRLIAQHCVEVIAGTRPAWQLQKLAQPGLHVRTARGMEGLLRNAAIRTAIVSRTGDTVFATATGRNARAAFAVALEIRWIDGRWRLSSVSVLPPRQYTH